MEFFQHKSDPKYFSIEAKIFSFETLPSKEAHMKLIFQNLVKGFWNSRIMKSGQRQILGEGRSAGRDG